MIRKSAYALLAAVALSVAPMVLAAGHATAQSAGPDGPCAIHIIGTELSDQVHLNFDPDTDEYVIEHGKPGVTVQGDGCYVERAFVVRCPSLVPSVIAQLGSGDDLLQGSSYYSAWPVTAFQVDAGAGSDDVFVGLGPTTIRGRAGDDNLVEGPFDDELRGGGGNDRLVGAAGSDFLSGGAGADLFVAGADGDRIRARDGEADADIHCGNDHSQESVTYDRGLDPKRRGCHLREGG